MTTIAERVAAGAKYLDEHDKGWWRADVDRAIDLDKLDLGDGMECILGQRCPLEYRQPLGDNITNYSAWGPLLSGAASAYDVDEWAAPLGFQLSHGNTWDEWDGTLSEFECLTAEWRRLIEARRSAS